MSIEKSAPCLRSILIVDDTPEDRAVVRRMLRRGEGREVELHEAESVAAGLRILEEIHVDCVLLDHNLPDGHGVDVLAALRRRQTANPIAAVYLTNAGVEAAAVAALQAGAQDFVQKDYLTSETIWRAVDNAIERVSMTRALAESEKRLKALSESLEIQVQRRTEALQRALDELTAFAYSMSHDLRAPIRAIVSSCRILVEDHGDQLSADAHAELDRQAVAGEKLGKLVDGLIQYARLGGERIQCAIVDVSEMSQQVADKVSGLGWNCDGAQYRIEPGIHAEADPSMLESVFTVLFDNACKFRRLDAEPRVEVFRDGDAICVRDNGIGFDMRYVHKLFRPFERLHRDQDYPGTGIGLANARRIVERHGGKIWAEGKPGEGSTFCFTLH